MHAASLIVLSISLKVSDFREGIGPVQVIYWTPVIGGAGSPDPEHEVLAVCEGLEKPNRAGVILHLEDDPE